MATDGPTPNPCDPEIFKKGQPVAAIDGRSNAVERWVQAVAKQANAKVDWHYSGGVAQVLHLGNAKSRAKVMQVMHELEPTLQGTVMRYFDGSDPGLYRQGVTETSPGTIAAYYEGGRGSTYITRRNSDQGNHS